MKSGKPSYRELEARLAAAEPIIAALKQHEVDAVIGEEKIAFLLLRKVEEAWLESHGEFSAMFNLGGIGLIQADSPDFRFTRINPKFCAITGYPAGLLLKKTYIELTHPLDRERDLRAFAPVIRGKTDAWYVEKRCLRMDGSIVQVAVHGCALRDQAGKIVRIIAMIEDLDGKRSRPKPRKKAATGKAQGPGRGKPSRKPRPSKRK